MLVLNIWIEFTKKITFDKLKRDNIKFHLSSAKVYRIQYMYNIHIFLNYTQPAKFIQKNVSLPSI